jgi:hypothetical protein
VTELRATLERERARAVRPPDNAEAQVRHLIQRRTALLQSGVYAAHDPLIRQLDARVNQLLVAEAFATGTPVVPLPVSAVGP